MNVSNIKFSALQDVYQKRQSAAPASSETRKQIHEPQAQPVGQQSVLAAKELNNEEKEFFKELFPAAANEIRSYQSYDKEGTKMAARLGAFVDKKG